MAVSSVQHTDFLAPINKLLEGSSALLDIGCGTGITLSRLLCSIKVGVDVHRPYLEKRQHSDGFIPVHSDACGLSGIFLPKSFDSVTLIDVIEHFEKDVALSVLNQAEKLAIRNVIVFTPRGFFVQDKVDPFNLGGEIYQKHRSGWEIDEFIRLGYKVIVFEHFHHEDNTSFVRSYGEGASPIDALLAWKDCASLGGSINANA